jgi:hypothetical protein
MESENTITDINIESILKGINNFCYFPLAYNLEIGKNELIKETQISACRIFDYLLIYNLKEFIIYKGMNNINIKKLNNIVDLSKNKEIINEIIKNIFISYVPSNLLFLEEKDLKQDFIHNCSINLNENNFFVISDNSKSYFDLVCFILDENNIIIKHIYYNTDCHSGDISINKKLLHFIKLNKLLINYTIIIAVNGYNKMKLINFVVNIPPSLYIIYKDDNDNIIKSQICPTLNEINGNYTFLPISILRVTNIIDNEVKCKIYIPDNIEGLNDTNTGMLNEIMKNYINKLCKLINNKLLENKPIKHFVNKPIEHSSEQLDDDIKVNILNIDYKYPTNILGYIPPIIDIRNNTDMVALTIVNFNEDYVSLIKKCDKLIIYHFYDDEKYNSNYYKNIIPNNIIIIYHITNDIKFEDIICEPFKQVGHLGLCILEKENNYYLWRLCPTNYWDFINVKPFDKIIYNSEILEEWIITHQINNNNLVYYNKIFYDYIDVLNIILKYDLETLKTNMDDILNYYIQISILLDETNFENFKSKLIEYLVKFTTIDYKSVKFTNNEIQRIIKEIKKRKEIIQPLLNLILNITSMYKCSSGTMINNNKIKASARSLYRNKIIKDNVKKSEIKTISLLSDLDIDGICLYCINYNLYHKLIELIKIDNKDSKKNIIYIDDRCYELDTITTCAIYEISHNNNIYPEIGCRDDCSLFVSTLNNKNNLILPLLSIFINIDKPEDIIWTEYANNECALIRIKWRASINISNPAELWVGYFLIELLLQIGESVYKPDIVSEDSFLKKNMRCILSYILTTTASGNIPLTNIYKFINNTLKLDVISYYEFTLLHRIYKLFPYAGWSTNIIIDNLKKYNIELILKIINPIILGKISCKVTRKIKYNKNTFHKQKQIIFLVVAIDILKYIFNNIKDNLDNINNENNKILAKRVLKLINFEKISSGTEMIITFFKHMSNNNIYSVSYFQHILLFSISLEYKYGLIENYENDIIELNKYFKNNKTIKIKSHNGHWIIYSKCNIKLEEIKNIVIDIINGESTELPKLDLDEETIVNSNKSKLDLIKYYNMEHLKIIYDLINWDINKINDAIHIGMTNSTNRDLAIERIKEMFDSL